MVAGGQARSWGGDYFGRLGASTACKGECVGGRWANDCDEQSPCRRLPETSAQTRRAARWASPSDPAPGYRTSHNLRSEIAVASERSRPGWELPGRVSGKGRDITRRMYLDVRWGRVWSCVTRVGPLRSASGGVAVGRAVRSPNSHTQHVATLATSKKRGGHGLARGPPQTSSTACSRRSQSAMVGHLRDLP